MGGRGNLALVMAMVFVAHSAEARFWEKCLHLVGLAGSRSKDKVVSAPTPRTEVDFKNYRLNGVGPLTGDSLKSEISTLGMEIRLQEYALETSSFEATPHGDAYAQHLERNQKLIAIEIQKQRLEKLTRLSELSEGREGVSLSARPIRMTHLSKRSDLSPENVDMQFHRDPLANVALGAHSGSGLYGFPTEGRSSAGNHAYLVTIKAGVRVVDSTRPQFQNMMTLVADLEAAKINALYNEYQVRRRDAGPGGLSRETFQKMYLYDTVADMLGADVVWAANYNGKNGGEYILRSRAAIEAWEPLAAASAPQ